MKPTGLIAALLSVTIPGSAFAQNLSAARVTTAPGASASAASGAVFSVPTALGALSPLSLTAPSMAPSLLPTPSVSPAATPVNAVVATGVSAASALTKTSPAAARAEALPASAVPAALSVAASAAGPVSAAAKADGKPGEQTRAGALAVLFDGAPIKSADDVDPAGLKAFVVRHGQPMREITLAEAAAHNGQVRLLTAKNDPTGLNEKHAAQVGALVRPGARKAVQQEKLAVEWSAPAKTPAQAETASASSARTPTTLASKLLWPFREAKFLAKSFASSLVKPLPSEILGGLATKSFPLVTSIGVYWAAVGLAHPFALGGLIALSVTQEVFHGFFLKSWNNFQEILRSKRGFNYQMFFNLAYMQGFGTLYRLLSWSANPTSVTPPWSVHYWKDMAVMSVVGTFFGVLGYNSLNALYAKGTINRWQHSGIQQVRDLCFLLAAPFFASGSMTVFWGIFLFQQSLDLAIAIWAGRAQSRELVFVTSAAVADSAEFKSTYPAEGVVIEPPLKQASKAVFDNPLVRLMTWPARALWKAARGGKK